MTFDWSDFLAPLDPPALAMMFVIGLGFGVIGQRSGMMPGHRFWLVASPFVFFVPLALFRGLEGVSSWERLLATGVTWLIFAGGFNLGSRWR